MFLKDTYGIKIPKIESIPFILLHKSTSRLYNPKKNAFGFVHQGIPAIYADFDVIEQEAIRMGKHIYDLSDAEKGILIRRLLEEINPHEYTHIIAETAYWHKGDRLPITVDEQKKAITSEGRLGIAVSSPKKEDRGGQLMEAVTVELTDRWAKSINGKLDINAYRGERDVLDALIKQLRADNPALSDHDAFVPFVKAYFEQHGFRYLAEALSGKYADAQGKIHFKRPHQMSIVYKLMNYEHDKQVANHRYPLTLAFIRGNLTDAQKREIQSLPLSEAEKRIFKSEPKTSPKPKVAENASEWARKTRLKKYADHFRKVSTPTDHTKPPIQEYFIEKPPQSITVSPDQLRSLELALPYFMFKKVGENVFAYPNHTVAPFTRDFMDTEATKQQRFYDLTRLDNDDSSTRALAGTIAPTPEAQAQVYDILIDTILKVHENNPGFLKKWIEAQFIDQDGLSSADQFIHYDLQRDPLREGLFYFLPKTVPFNQQAATPEYISEIWKSRIKTLRSKSTFGFDETDHRQLEMLAHSVNVKGIIDLIKSQMT
jgi:hypothetical protein